MDSIKKLKKICAVIVIISILSIYSFNNYAITPKKENLLKMGEVDTGFISGKDNLLDFDKDNYIICGLPWGDKSVKLINKRNYKVVKSYKIELGCTSEYITGDQADSKRNCRYWGAACTYKGVSGYTDYIIDLITGKNYKLDDISLPILNFYSCPNSDVIVYSTDNNYYSIIKLANGKKVNHVKISQMHNLSMCSPNGKYVLFYENNSLYLLSTVDFSKTLIKTAVGIKPVFIDWLPASDGFIYAEDKKIMVFYAAKSEQVDTGIMFNKKVDRNSQYNPSVLNILFSWNKAQNKLAFMDYADSSGKIYYYDLLKRKYENDIVNDFLPGNEGNFLEYKIIWNSNDQKIGIVGLPPDYPGDCFGALIVYDGKTYFKVEQLCKNPIFYKNYVVFGSDVDLVGNYSTMYHSITFLNLATKEENSIKAEWAEITPDGKNMIIYNEKEEAYLLDSKSFLRSRKLDGLITQQYDSNRFGIQENDDRYSNGKRIIISHKNNGYDIFDYKSLKTQPLIRYDKSINVDKDLFSSNKSGVFIWNDKLRFLYFYDWNKLYYSKINKDYNIVYLDAKSKTIILSKKSVKKLYFYKMGSV